MLSRGTPGSSPRQPGASAVPRPESTTLGAGQQKTLRQFLLEVFTADAEQATTVLESVSFNHEKSPPNGELFSW